MDWELSIHVTDFPYEIIPDHYEYLQHSYHMQHCTAFYFHSNYTIYCMHFGQLSNDSMDTIQHTLFIWIKDQPNKGGLKCIPNCLVCIKAGTKRNEGNKLISARYPLHVTFCLSLVQAWVNYLTKLLNQKLYNCCRIIWKWIESNNMAQIYSVLNLFHVLWIHLNYIKCNIF